MALGTAQFGLPYGIANRSGQVPAAEVARILDQAQACGVDTLDTAMAYGESESCLGSAGIGGWRVVTKLPAVPEHCDDVSAWVERQLEASLARLRVPSLYGLLLHRPLQLTSERGPSLYQALRAARDRGVTAKLGVSVYSPQELELLWPRFELDLVQAPFSVFDRRLLTSGWLARLADAGVEVHTRSAFLQGLLLMTAAERPQRFARWQRLWQEWERWLEQQQLSALSVCLGYVLSQPQVARVIVGVDSLAQLQEIVHSAAATAPTPPPDLSSDALELIDPSRWHSA